MTKDKVIILGAGRPVDGNIPSSLVLTSVGEVRVLDWVINAFSNLKVDFQFVGGYKIEKVAEFYPEISYVLNANWQYTGSVGSLYSVELEENKNYYVCYSDVIFRPEVIRNIEKSVADIVIGADRNWLTRYANRTDIESAERISIVDGTVKEIGTEINLDKADAEFIGLVKLSTKAIKIINSIKDDRDKKFHLPFLLNKLIECGLSVDLVHAEDQWAELNSTRDLANFIFGTKADTLSRLHKLVKTCKIADQVTFKVEEWHDNKSTIIDMVNKEFADNKLVVRSSATSEDGFESSNAGKYQSILDVNMGSLESAVNTVINSYPANENWHQVLVQPMIKDVILSGVIFTRNLSNGSPYITINYNIGSSTEIITSGDVDDCRTLIVHKGEELPSDTPAALNNILKVIKEIEALIGYDSLDIEFAICKDLKTHVLQVRPIAVLHDREISDEAISVTLEKIKLQFNSLQNPSPFILGEKAVFGIMPDWNPAEIIGTKPNALANSTYQYIVTDNVWSTQRAEFGYRDVREKALLVNFAGHPYIDIRASFNSFVPANIEDSLAEKLINFYVNYLQENPHLHDKVEFEVLPTCYSFNFDKWRNRLLESKCFDISQIDKLQSELKTITINSFSRIKSNTDKINKLEDRFEKIIGSNISKLDKALLLLSDCKSYGTLPFAHLARAGFVAVTFLKSAVEIGHISSEELSGFLNSIRTITHEFTEDAELVFEGKLEFEKLVAKYGHLRPGTYNILSDCYADDPEKYLLPLIVKQQEHLSNSNFDLRKWDTLLDLHKLDISAEEFDKFLREAIAGREYSKFIFSRNLSAALNLLVMFGKENGINRDQVANLDILDFIYISKNISSITDINEWLYNRSEEGKKQNELSKLIELPPLIFNEENILSFHYPESEPNYVGLSAITANIAFIENVESQTLNLKGKIVLIPQADPGYDWIFGQGISGLITMYGGANSHMAIRSAEFGIPAAIGIGENMYNQLIKSKFIELNCKTRQIKAAS